MTDFHDVRFPTALAFGASGGPEFITEIIQLSNGKEVRNTPHALPRRRYNALAGLKSVEDIIALKEFFVARRGRLYSFRFLDPFDNRSCAVTETLQASDQTIGVGDGAQTAFQLQKSYTDDASVVTRPITKPHEGSVVLAVNNIPLLESDFTLNALTGVVTLSAPLGSGDTLTAGFQFDTIVRFDTDFLDLTLEDFGAAQLRDLPMVEVPYA